MITLKQALDSTEIKQQYFGNKSTSELNNIFGPDFCVTLNDDIQHHYIVYINDTTPLALCHIYGDYITEEAVKNIPDLKDVLNQLPDINDASLLFTLSIYSLYDKIDIATLLRESKKFEYYAAYDDLLLPTYGYVVYKHQLEQLIARISNDNSIYPEQLRIGWNKKSHKTIDYLNTLMLTDTLNLTAFLRERTMKTLHCGCGITCTFFH
jgi:hypothetical protein